MDRRQPGAAADRRGPTCPRSRANDPIAIVGMAAHFGPFDGRAAFQDRVLGGRLAATRPAPRRWWHVEAGSTKRHSIDLRGFYLDAFRLGADRFRIPPRELEEMLPQQSLMLKVAAEAIDDAAVGTGPGLRTGVVIGLGLDLNTTNFQLRWWLVDQVARWNRELGLGLSDEELDAWVDEAARGDRPSADGEPDDGLAGRAGRQPDRPRVPDRRAELHRLVRRDVGNSGPAGRGRLAPAGRARRGDRRRGRPGRRRPGRPRVEPASRRGSARRGGRGPRPQAAGRRAARRRPGLRDDSRHLGESRDGPSVRGRREAGHRGGFPCPRECAATGSVESEIGRPGAAAGLASVARAALCLYQQILPATSGPPVTGCGTARRARAGCRGGDRAGRDSPSGRCSKPSRRASIPALSRGRTNPTTRSVTLRRSLRSRRAIPRASRRSSPSCSGAP